ncbi:hypothetical protein ACFW04_012390 [Cataglyphis niger]
MRPIETHSDMLIRSENGEATIPSPPPPPRRRPRPRSPPCFSLPR